MSDDRPLADALEPGALQKSVEQILAAPPPDSGTQVDVAVIKTEQDAGAEVKVTSAGSWWSAGWWAQWREKMGFATGAIGSFRFGQKKSRR